MESEGGLGGGTQRAQPAGSVCVWWDTEPGGQGRLGLSLSLSLLGTEGWAGALRGLRAELGRSHTGSGLARSGQSCAAIPATTKALPARRGPTAGP